MGNGCTSIRAANVVETGSNLPKLKVVVVGESLSGKTCVAQRYHKNLYPEKYEPTKDVNIFSIVKKVNIPDQGIVSIELWDVPGHEGVDVRKTYYLNADAVIVIIDLNDEDAYIHASTWKRDAVSHVRHTSKTNGHLAPESNGLRRVQEIVPKVGSVPILLLGNKFDLAKQTFLRENYSMCNDNSSKVTFSSYETQLLKKQGNGDINGHLPHRKASLTSRKSLQQPHKVESSTENLNSDPLKDNFKSDVSRDVTDESDLADKSQKDSDEVAAQNDPLKSTDPIITQTESSSAAVELPNTGEDNEKTPEPTNDKTNLDPTVQSGELEKNSVADDVTEEEKGKDKGDSHADDPAAAKEKYKKKREDAKESDAASEGQSKEVEEPNKDEVDGVVDKKVTDQRSVEAENKELNETTCNKPPPIEQGKNEEKQNVAEEVSAMKNEEEKQLTDDKETELAPDQPITDETGGSTEETSDQKRMEDHPDILVVKVDEAATQMANGTECRDEEVASNKDSPLITENKNIEPPQRKLKKIFPKDLITLENESDELQKSEKNQRKDSNSNLLDVSSQMVESVSMVSLLPPCVEQLESFAQENGFIAGIPVSAKDPKGGVHEAVQSLIRHLISKRRENGPEQKRKKDEISVRSQLSVARRTRKMHNHSLAEDFEPLQEVGIIEIDEVLRSCNPALRESESLTTSFRESIHDFKRECYNLKLIGGKQVSVEECVSALKEAVESSRTTNNEKSDVRMALLMRDSEPKFSLVAIEMNDFVNLQVADDNHEYISLGSGNEGVTPLSADVLSILKVYQEKVYSSCSRIMRRSSELESILRQHFHLIAAKEEKAWDMAVAAGHPQPNVRRILTGVAQGKARVRGTLEQIKDTKRLVDATKTKIRAALLF